MSDIAEVSDLYRVDPAAFVAARAALVKELRAAGRKDDARVVVKLRKPTVSSWALDQVAVDHPDLLDDALAAGDALREATEQTMGGDASNLRAATDAERAAAAKVIEAAGAYLPSLTTEHRDRMAATLRAAITDDDVRVDLVAGVLAADHEPSAMGFAAASGGAAAPAAPAPQKTAAEKAAELAAEPDAPPKRKIRRVGTPSSARKAPPDEVDARRRAKEAERAEADAAERKAAEEAARKRAEERKRLQAELDTTARKARKAADAAAKAAEQAEATAQKARDEADAARSAADAAAADADAAEAAADAGPPGLTSRAEAAADIVER